MALRWDSKSKVQSLDPQSARAMDTESDRHSAQSWAARLGSLWGLQRAAHSASTLVARSAAPSA